jgi:hypothetical protein
MHHILRIFSCGSGTAALALTCRHLFCTFWVIEDFVIDMSVIVTLVLWFLFISS